MKNPKLLIIKIAFGVSAAAFLFSIVTLIRNIVVGAMVFVTVMQVIGAGVIVIICFAMLRIFSGMDEEEESDERSGAEETDDPQPDAPFPDDFGLDDFTYDNFPEPPADDGISSEGYDLQLFDDES